MKSFPQISPRPLVILPLAIVALLLASTPLNAFTWTNRWMQSLHEVFIYADVNRNNNLDAHERDRLRIAFEIRDDLLILDTNGNRKLDKEEIDSLEFGKKKREKKDKKKKNR